MMPAVTGASTRAIPEVLRDWRAAEERLLHEGGDRARELVAEVNELRDEYRRLCEARTLDPLPRARSRPAEVPAPQTHIR